jgi:thioredoxin 1
MKKFTFISIVFISVILSMVSCNSGSSSKNITILTTDNFDAKTGKGVVLVDFWATWCMPCKAMAPVIEEIATQTTGKVKVGKVDIDANGSLANQFGIQAIPTFVILKDGKAVETLVGLQSKEAIVNALSKYVSLH